MAVIRALAKPELIRWVRESAGLSEEEASTRLRVPLDRFLDWEAGEKRPTINQLRRLGDICHRPLAVFFLSEIPTDFKPLRDFRTLSSEPTRQYSPELRFAIREAQFRQQAVQEILEASGEVWEPPVFLGSATLRNSPVEIAQKLRQQMTESAGADRPWQDAYEALRTWTDRIEATGVLVFQVERIPVEEMRGFSIGGLPPVIALNSKDSPTGRVFSLIHELAHLALGEDGVSGTWRAGRNPNQQTEAFCNAVAAEFLVPATSLRADDHVTALGPPDTWGYWDLASVGKRYGVSAEVILRRLAELGVTTKAHYRQVREELLRRYEEIREEQREGTFFMKYAQRVVRSAGRRFTRTVFEAYFGEVISGSQVSDYLGTRVKHFEGIEALVFGPARAGAR